MGGGNQICNRKEPRFKIAEGSKLACDTVVGESDARQGIVVDVSSTGMRMLCTGRFKAGQKVSTELSTDQSHGVFRGIVRRVEPWVNGQSLLGCQLLDSIPAEVLEELASQGIVNRRTENRVAWDQPAALSWELQPGEIEVKICDYSQGGMRVYSEKAIPDSVRLRIRLNSGDDEQIVVEAKSVWKDESEDGIQVGLQFTNRDAPELIERLHRTGSAKEAPRERILITRPVIGAAITVFAAIVLLGVSVMAFAF